MPIKELLEYLQDQGYHAWLDKFIEEHEDHLDEISVDSFDGVLDGIKLVAKYDDFNICYHGRECTAYSKTIFEWDKYIILYIYDTEGDDLDVLSISANYGDVNNFFDKCFAIHKRDKIDVKMLLANIDGKPISDMEFVIRFFTNFYGDLGEKKFLQFVKKMYQLHPK